MSSEDVIKKAERPVVGGIYVVDEDTAPRSYGFLGPVRCVEAGERASIFVHTTGKPTRWVVFNEKVRPA